MKTQTQPQSLIDSFANTPKDGVWYLMGSNINAENIDPKPTDKEITTVVAWDEDKQDWKFMTFKDGTINTGMVELNKTFGVEE